MSEERAKEHLDRMLGFIADRYGLDGLFEITSGLGVNDNELSLMGWPAKDQD